MLLSFQVSNHKSIRAEQTLHLQPVYDKSRPALPVAAIFGANAAGKSNLLDALSFMVDAVRHSFIGWRDGIGRSPFRLDMTSTGQPSSFMVELLLDGVRWSYGFTVDSSTVIEEWLYSYPQHRRRVIFDRDAQTVTAGPAGGLARNQVKTLAEIMPPSALFLTVAGGDLLEQLAPIHRWFTSGVTTIPTPSSIIDEQMLIRRLENPHHRHRLVGLLVASDVGIVDVEVEILLSMPLSLDGEVDTTAVRELLDRRLNGGRNGSPSCMARTGCGWRWPTSRTAPRSGSATSGRCSTPLTRVGCSLSTRSTPACTHT